MKSFGKILIDERVVLPEVVRGKVINDAKIFAEKSYALDQGKYLVENRSARKERIVSNNRTGKIAEFLAAVFLNHKYGFPEIIPDLEIRVGKEKGWQEDLPYHKRNQNFPSVHVKSCDRMSEEYVGDISYTFQYSNSDGQYGKDKLFWLPEDTNDMIIMMFVEDDQSYEGIVKSFLPWRIVKNYLSDPKSEKFKGIKKCLYVRDLISNRKEIEKLLLAA